MPPLLVAGVCLARIEGGKRGEKENQSICWWYSIDDQVIMFSDKVRSNLTAGRWCQRTSCFCPHVRLKTRAIRVTHSLSKLLKRIDAHLKLFQSSSVRSSNRNTPPGASC